MSAYSKDPSGANPELETVSARPIVAMDPEKTESPARRPFRSALGGAASLLLEMAQVADYCRGLEKSAYDEQRRADEVRARLEEERGKFHQALLNSKLEIRRYGTELKKAAAELQALVARSSQAASQLEEMTRREAAARAELTTYRARTDAEREAMGNRMREGEKDHCAATERFAKREMQLEERARALEGKIKEQEAAAELAKLEFVATQSRVQTVTRQLERQQAALKDFAELQNRHRALEQRCAAVESTLAEGKSKYRGLVDRFAAAKQRNLALEQELARLREANRVLGEKAVAIDNSLSSSALASESTAVRKANAELRERNEALTAELAQVRKAVPLIELLRLKEGELERLAGELAKTPELDATRRGAIITRRDAVTLQRDQLANMLKRFQAKP